MQVWPDAGRTARNPVRYETWRQDRAWLYALSPQVNQGLEQALIAAGFADAQVKDRATDFCALAVKPIET